MTMPELVKGAVVTTARATVGPARLGATLRRHAVLLVLCFWWTATGVLYALQRNAWTRGVALVGAVLCLGAATRLLLASRRDASAIGGLRAFFAGALAWTGIITLFFEGWVVGPPPSALGEATRGLDGAWAAIVATWHWEALALATMGAMALAVRGAANRLALWTLLLFWGAHQSAKLNLFLGVVNSGAEIFPPYLSHLVRYFGPTVNSPFLWVTIAGYTALAAWMLWPRAALGHGARMQRVVIGAVAGLAAIEHAFLATRIPFMLWELYLRVGRG